MGFCYHCKRPYGRKMVHTSNRTVVYHQQSIALNYQVAPPIYLQPCTYTSASISVWPHAPANQPTTVAATIQSAQSTIQSASPTIAPRPATNVAASQAADALQLIKHLIQRQQQQPTTAQARSELGQLIDQLRQILSRNQ